MHAIAPAGSAANDDIAAKLGWHRVDLIAALTWLVLVPLSAVLGWYGAYAGVWRFVRWVMS